jgi:pimeloyl-ACP methyl ester carboxylesterase
MPAPVTAHVASRRESIAIRGINMNLRRWGDAGARPILFLHGAQDSSITFQFVVDALKGDWSIVAPDWRGHGHSDWARPNYWFHEFVADLDALMDRLFPDQAVPVVGHSLGGNIASIYAGLRPERVTHVISLDGLGPLITHMPVDIGAILGRYLDDPKKIVEHRPYATLTDMARRLMRGSPRLDADKAEFLAEHSSFVHADGSRRWLYDPSFSRSLPSLRGMDEWGAIWARIRAPVLWIASDERRPGAPTGSPETLASRKAFMGEPTFLQLAGASHNLHHDCPGDVAAAVEAFVGGTWANYSAPGNLSTGVR